MLLFLLTGNQYPVENCKRPVTPEQYGHFVYFFSHVMHLSTSKGYIIHYSLPQVRLAVAGAFHTGFMEPAVSRLEAALAATEIRTPKFPVISNVDAQPHADPGTIKKILARQVSYSKCALLTRVGNFDWLSIIRNYRSLPLFSGRQQ